jgi:hypothetical protein
MLGVDSKREPSGCAMKSRHTNSFWARPIIFNL